MNQDWVWEITLHTLENCLPSHGSYCTAMLSNLHHGMKQSIKPPLHYPTKWATGSSAAGCQKLKGIQQATLLQSYTDSTATSASLRAVFCTEQLWVCLGRGFFQSPATGLLCPWQGANARRKQEIHQHLNNVCLKYGDPGVQYCQSK